MLNRLHVVGFKSLHDVTLQLPRLTVLFGPNAAGKSNVLDVIQAISRIGTARTLADAFHPLRGYPTEAFSFPPGGLTELLSNDAAKFSLEADVATGKDLRERYRYRVAVEINPKSGSLAVRDEYLAALNAAGNPKERPRIEVVGDRIHVRRKSQRGQARHEDIGQGFTVLSDYRWTGQYYRPFDAVRRELNGWRTYYFDPMMTMRWSNPPAAVVDIGTYGQHLAPFLHRLKTERPKHFDSLKRTLRALIPSIEDVSVELDQRRGVLDLAIKQGGTEFSSRIVSEGTLRVLGLCAMAVNPWNASLLAFEEPENGVHPRRLELIAELLFHLAIGQGRQLVITTHSLLFCDAMLRKAKESDGGIGLFRVKKDGPSSVVLPLNVEGPLFRDQAIRDALTSGNEDGLFESLELRGMLDDA